MTESVRSGALLVLSPGDFAPLMSTYLDDGLRHDRVVIREIALRFPHATARLDVTEYSMPQNGRYHFTAPHAMVCVSQVGIVLACVAQGLTAKPGEVYMRDFTIVCRREINQAAGLTLRCSMVREQKGVDAVLYELAYDYCAGAFTGTVRCLFPLPRASA